MVPKTISISITSELVRDANSSAFPDLLIQKLLGKSQLSVFNKPPRGLLCSQSLSTTAPAILNHLSSMSYLLSHCQSFAPASPGRLQPYPLTTKTPHCSSGLSIYINHFFQDNFPIQQSKSQAHVRNFTAPCTSLSTQVITIIECKLSVHRSQSLSRC